MSEEWPTDEVFALLDDRYARAILLATSSQPMSAKALSEECEFSLPTVYRRVERLVDCGLLRERTNVADDGHHHSVYETRVERLEIEIDEGELSLTVEELPADDVADRFTTMWEGI